jgi:hypothetical protein
MPGDVDQGLTLHGVRLVGADLSGRRLRDASIGVGSSFVGCDFRRTRIEGGGLGDGFEPTVYEDCRFDGARLRHVFPGRATFIRCSFRLVRIEDFRCFEAEFIDCVFSGHLTTVIFSATPTTTERLGRCRNRYTGNDFTEARLFDVAFRGGIDLNEQRLPQGEEYIIVRNAPSRLPDVRDHIAAWPEADLKSDAESVLWLLQNLSQDGQNDIFVDRQRFGEHEETMRRLVAMLAEV